MSTHKEREERRQGGSGKGRGKPNAADWEILEGWAVILGFFKWCSFAACVACFLSNALAWPWLATELLHGWAPAGRDTEETAPSNATTARRLRLRLTFRPNQDRPGDLWEQRNPS